MTGTDSILVCLFTSGLQHSSPVRVVVEPNGVNGLREPSQIMVDKIYAVRRNKCGTRIGRLNVEKLSELDECLAIVVGLTDASLS